MSKAVLNVLFLCTGNSARSVMAEAILNDIGQGRFKAYSAGSTPRGSVHPLTLDTLNKAKLPTEGLRSKPWDEFAGPQAPVMDFVITVCDNAAGEVCPIWPGRPMTTHWGFEDPAAFIGSPVETAVVFQRVFREIASRLHTFAALPIEALDRLRLKREMDAIDTPITPESAS
jgi:arsenate reductase